MDKISGELSIPLNDQVEESSRFLFEIVQVAMRKIDEKGKIPSAEKRRLIEQWNQIFRSDDNALAKRYSDSTENEKYLLAEKIDARIEGLIVQQSRPCCFSFCRPTYYQITGKCPISADEMEDMFDELKVPQERKI